MDARRPRTRVRGQRYAALVPRCSGSDCISQSGSTPLPLQLLLLLLLPLLLLLLPLPLPLLLPPLLWKKVARN